MPSDSPPGQPAQFAHLRAASPQPRPSKRGKDRRWSASQLLDEADRVPKASRHVPKPQPPIWHIGSRKAVEERAAEWHAQAREASGKARLRVTSPSLACAVVSWPSGRNSQWPAYRDAILAHFVRTLGTDRVAGAVEHRDEKQLHIHVFFVPRDGEDFGAVHPGVRARRVARAQPGNMVFTAFTQAMRKWQDDLWSAVSGPFGLTRTGPRVQRLERKEVLVNKKVVAAKELEDAAKAEATALVEEARRQAELTVRRVRETEDQAKELLAKVTDAELAVNQKYQLFARTPAAEHEARLRARDATIQELLAKVAGLERQVGDLRFNVEQHSKKAVSTDQLSDRRAPKPSGHGW